MRMTRRILVVSAALAMLATPVLAVNTKAHKPDSEETTPSCTSYQLDQNGNWTPLPCHELGTSSSSQHRAPQKPHDHEER
jgi:hypothetical protein